MSLNWNGIGLSMLWQGVGKRDWYPWTESGFFWGKWNRAYNSLMKTQTGDRVVKIDKSIDNWRVTNMDKNPYWTRMVSLAANRNEMCIRDRISYPAGVLYQTKRAFL